MSSTFRVICDLHFERDRLATNVFHAHASTLMEELHPLDECNDCIADALVSSDAGKAVMTVEMFVAASDPFEASELALGITRTALHMQAPIPVAGRSRTSPSRRGTRRNSSTPDVYRPNLWHGLWHEIMIT